MMLERRREARTFGAASAGSGRPVVDVGILTRGKPTLGITLSSLLLQDSGDLRIHIVDTGDSPVVNRDEVTLAMRLAFDREVPCSYERLRERKRGFSLGRLRLLDMLRGPHICFVDDDMALTASVIGRMLAAALRYPGYGSVNPRCLKATVPLGSDPAAQRYTAGGLIRLDSTLRAVLTAYYAETVDVVDATKSTDRVWEVAFLGEVLARLGRPSFAEPEAVIYHLDYHELNNWSLGDPAIVRRSVAVARRLTVAGAEASLAV